MDTNKLQDLQAEKVVLANLMNDENAYLNIFISQDDFFDENHKKIFNVLTKEYTGDNRSELVFELKDTKLENYALIDVKNTRGNLYSHQKAVQKASNTRKCLEILKNAPNHLDKMPYSSVINHVVDQLSELELSAGSSSIETAEQVGNQRLEYYYKLRKGDIEPAIPTYLPKLDRAIGGFAGGELITIGATTGTGKTAFMMSLVHEQTKRGYKAGVFSVEMRNEKIFDRLALMFSEYVAKRDHLPEITLQHFMNRTACEEHYDTMDASIVEAMKMPLYMYKGNDWGIKKIALEIKKMVRLNGCQIIYLDYIQLLEGVRNKGYSREREVASISRALKMLSNDLNIPIIALAQLNKDAESAEYPKVSHIRESHAIAQDSNKVFLLRRKGTTDLSANVDPSVAELFVSKNRDGETKNMEIKLNGNLIKFVEKSNMPEPLDIDRF